MGARYHVGKDGQPRKCTAQSPESCPVTEKDENGKVINHFDSESAADSYGEKISRKTSSGRLRKKALDRDSIAEPAPADAPEDLAEAAAAAESGAVKPVPCDLSTDWKPVKRSLLDNKAVGRQDFENMMEIAVGAKGADQTRTDIALAGNTPTAVLTEIYHRYSTEKPAGSKQILSALAQNKQTPVWILRELAEPCHSESVRLVVAANPATPASALDSMVGENPKYVYDKGVMERVAGNPSVSPDTLRRIHGCASRTVSMLENRMQLNHGRLDNEYWAAKVWTEEVCKNLALNPKSPGSVAVKALTTLAGSRAGQGDNVYETRYRVIAARDPRTPPKVLAEMAAERNLSSAVYASIAANPSTPRDVAEAIVSCENLNVLRQACNGPLDSSLSIRLAIAAAPMPPKVLDDLAGDRSVDLRTTVAYNPTAPAGTLSKLAADECMAVRRAVAGNPGTPADAIDEILAAKPDHRVSRPQMWIDREYLEIAAAGNPSTNRKTLEQIERRAFADTSRKVILLNRLKRRLAGNPSTSDETLRKLAEESALTFMKDGKRAADAASILSNLANNPSTPVDALALISRQKTREFKDMHAAVDVAVSRLETMGRSLTNDGKHSRWLFD